MEQRRHLASINEFRRRRDVHQVSPRFKMLYDNYDSVDGRALVNRLQDKACAIYSGVTSTSLPFYFPISFLRSPSFPASLKVLWEVGLWVLLKI